ncbi:MAG: amidase, hydantoinase/carbamoylase family [Bryobacterales bacterium]|nr:amidase, hydantoinase/carbamoylase family [Bryobacterales bacterium]
MERFLSVAQTAIDRCRMIAQYSEEPGVTTRTFLSEPMHAVHRCFRSWMEAAGMRVTIDHAGNLRGYCEATHPNAPRLFIGSHLDTVPRAGAFDGILGVVLGVALVEILAGRRMTFQIEVVGFSEEEGVRFGVPFIGSRALVGQVDDELLARGDAAGVRVSDAIAAFGLDPARIQEAQASSDALGYLEFHIEQGPVLDRLNLPLGVVEAIVGQSRGDVIFEGRANHAGTTPMNLRHDALAGAGAWIGAVEREALATSGLVATVGSLEVEPGATNVIAGSARAGLDVRHADDTVRREAVRRMIDCAQQIAVRRGLKVRWEPRLDQSAVAMDAGLMELLGPFHRMTSGAGHDAMILARRMPVAMLFLRSPGGISHHPDEAVLADDVAAALETGIGFLERLDARHG